MGARQMGLVTKITGVINDVPFAAEGIGMSTPDTGHSSIELKFSNELRNFVPLLCKTWKCKHCKSVALPTNCNENFFAELLDRGEKILEHTTIEYPFANDKILATSICMRPEPTKQVVYQTRLGTYSGPIDIVEQLPFDDHIYPAGRGRAIAESVRRVVRKDGTEIAIKYTDQIIFSEQYELPSKLVIRYGGGAIWVPEELTLKLKTQTLLEEVVSP